MLTDPFHFLSSRSAFEAVKPASVPLLKGLSGNDGRLGGSPAGSPYGSFTEVFGRGNEWGPAPESFGGRTARPVEASAWNGKSWSENETSAPQPQNPDSFSSEEPGIESLQSFKEDLQERHQSSVARLRKKTEEKTEKVPAEARGMAVSKKAAPPKAGLTKKVSLEKKLEKAESESHAPRSRSLLERAETGINRERRVRLDNPVGETPDGAEAEGAALVPQPVSPEGKTAPRLPETAVKVSEKSKPGQTLEKRIAGADPAVPEEAGETELDRLAPASGKSGLEVSLKTAEPVGEQNSAEAETAPVKTVRRELAAFSQEPAKAEPDKLVIVDHRERSGKGSPAEAGSSLMSGSEEGKDKSQKRFSNLARANVRERNPELSAVEGKSPSEGAVKGVRYFESVTDFGNKAGNSGGGLRQAGNGLLQRMQESPMAQNIRQLQFHFIDEARGEIRLSLNPEHLGRVRIRLSLDGNQLSGQIVAENQDAARLLQDHLQNLEQSFREGGFERGKLDVSVNDGNPREQGSGGSHGRSSAAETDSFDRDSAGGSGSAFLEETSQINYIA